MLRMIVYLTLLTALGYGALWLTEHPGRVSIEWMNYHITTLLSVFVFVSLGVITLICAIILLIRQIVTAPRRMRQRRAIKRKDDGLLALTHSLSALALGDHSAASKQLSRAKSLLDRAPATLLLSAQIARNEGKDSEANASFTAMLDSPETRAVGLRGMIEQAITHKQFDSALEHAKEAYLLRPKDKWLTLILLDLYCRNEQWADSLEMLKHGTRYAIFSHAQSKRYEGLIQYQRALAAIAKGEEDTAIALLVLSRKSQPDFIPSASLLVQLYAKRDEGSLSGKKLQSLWNEAPHALIIDAMLDRLSDLPAAKLSKQFDKLVETNRDHPESQMALARMNMHIGEWDSARGHLKAALNMHESARLYQLFAEVEKQSTGDEAAVNEWLQRAVSAPKEAAWVCDACGHHSDEWGMHCANCDAFDSVVWDRPEQKTQLLAG